MSRVVGIAALVLAFACPVEAQDPSRDRLVDIRFRPTARAQIAVWVTNEDAGIFRTVLLTRVTATHGIGNRPGASQMNSGFRWPYGRRENVLPVWGHARAQASGSLFPRVIFNGRESEGLASVSSGEPGNTRDDYFCLSFTISTTRRDALDAVACASPFMSNKGRYLTPEDRAAAYAEPWEEPEGAAIMRPLPLGSPYPPRRDLLPCTASSCNDHEDIARYDADVRALMPEIDEVTAATPQEDRLQELQLTVPPEWPDGEYVAWIEVNVEGDYNARFNEATYPTPRAPTGEWDSWAMNYGYAYRGQPSVVYRVPFELSASGGEYATGSPHGYGDVLGLDGEVRPMDGAITDDPETAPGSGADRLRLVEPGVRFAVSVTPTNVCGQPEPPPECDMSCGPSSPCPGDFVCGPEGRCIGMCDLEMPPPEVAAIAAETHPDVEQAHHYAVLRFVVPDHVRDIREYEVRVSPRPIVDLESFQRGMPANAASLESVELAVPTDGAAGELVEVELGGLTPETHYYIGVRPIDTCNDAGEISVAEMTTSEVYFTTVSPCFVATAAHGSAMAPDVASLRRLRDRHLATNGPGRVIVRVYESIGPALADAIRDEPGARFAARVGLTPAVLLARLLD